MPSMENDKFKAKGDKDLKLGSFTKLNETMPIKLGLNVKINK